MGLFKIVVLFISIAGGLNGKVAVKDGYIRGSDLGSLPGWQQYTGDVALLDASSNQSYSLKKEDVGIAGQLSFSYPVLSFHTTSCTTLGVIEQLQSLITLYNVRQAYLAHNSLIDITALLPYKEELEALWLSDNKLTSLPVGLTELTNLKKLCLDTNQLTSIAGLEKLINLETKLCLRGNLLTAIPEIAHMPNLYSLDIRNNKIACLDESWIFSGPNHYEGLCEILIDDEVLIPISWCTSYSAPTSCKKLIEMFPNNYYFLNAYDYQNMFSNFIPRIVRLTSGRIFVAGIGEPASEWSKRSKKWAIQSLDC